MEKIRNPKTVQVSKETNKKGEENLLKILKELEDEMMKKLKKLKGSINLDYFLHIIFSILENLIEKPKYLENRLELMLERIDKRRNELVDQLAKLEETLQNNFKNIEKDATL